MWRAPGVCRLTRNPGAVVKGHWLENRGRARRAISQLPAGLLDFLSCEVGLLLPLPLTEHLYTKHFHEY